ncbi:signal transduction histidine kinase [Hymenobacter luteus]|uniref:histidine kinase n=2 Tax=Hymenobacter TaxID=89966 RepID=A0A7W9T1G0_9BACT|nr:MULTISPECIES: ATP-binding protein [Hymenobacter]MBB4601034.1 signal transduction histidine kinase [Hymenobacter latericoloratus]MBB6058759.1 signal transduction histidine kinase [Hymenobacter luteus]
MSAPSSSLRSWPAARTIRGRVGAWLSHWWWRAINLGVQPGLTVWQLKRLHLLNGICWITIGIYAGYVLVYLNSPDWLTLRICLAGLVLHLPPLVLNYYHRYDASAYYNILSVTLICSLTAVVRRYNGVEYFLITNSIVGMLFFRTFWKLTFLFLVNVAAYFAVRYAMTVVTFSLYVPGSAYFYNINVALCFLTLFLVVYYFRSENLQQETLLSRQNESLAQSLQHLRTTQAQLVQQEKLASLGALTAGIAHEIQNPLNFVDNFSEVGLEMVQELREALATETLSKEAQQNVALLLDDLTQSQQKVHEHADRAGSIVRAMLQHSRAGTGQRQPTNLNALCDEYLRLAYHGLRAKDPNFNATLTTDFALHLAPVAVVAEDLGRVLLNLFTNALYAVQQKSRHAAPGTYHPTIAVSTRQLKNTGQVLIQVRDNGTGISPQVLEQVFHPFFTTKPPGEGTGLGLSLSYDIVTKGHGGTLSVCSQEGEYSEFSIRLPAPRIQA